MSKLQLSRKSVLKMLNDELVRSAHRYRSSYRTSPTFKVGDIVFIETRPERYNMGKWSYFDDLRLKLRGRKCVVVGFTALSDEDTPKQYSNWLYTVMFADGKRVVFSEEQLHK